MNSARIASEGAKSVAAKQKEIVKGVVSGRRGDGAKFKPSGNPQDILAKQSELARKAFDAAIQNTNDIAELVEKTNADAFNTLAGRITESVNEMRGTLERGIGGTKEKP